MYASILVASTLGAVAVLAAPVYPDLNVNAAMPGNIDVVSDYFNLLAQKVQESRQMSAAPVCDLSKAKLPLDAIANGLPPPSQGLTLKHVAIGRGTQNYTCDLANSTAVPVANGAVATLFNASCVASTYPDLLQLLPKVAIRFNLTGPEQSVPMQPANLAISGHHFFTNATTPFFNLDTAAMQLGTVPTAKNSSANAPADAPKGQNGESAVAWLKLLARSGGTGDLQEIYRVGTAGGAPPAKCQGMPATFEVQYSAEYWFYEGHP